MIASWSAAARQQAAARRPWAARILVRTGRWAVCLAVLLVAVSAWGQAGGEFDHDGLVKALTTGSETLKQTTLTKLDALGQDDRVADVLLEAVEKARLTGAVPESSLEMLFLLGKFIERDEVASVMWKCLDSSHPKVVMIAVDSLGERGDARALDGIIKLVDSPTFHDTFGFRKCVVEALMKIEDPRSVDTLVAQLPNLEGQLEYDVVRYLSHISRQRFGTQSDLWKTWWEDNQEDFGFNETNETFVLEGTPPADFK